jgi:uncharacterized membrane protein
MELLEISGEFQKMLYALFPRNDWTKLIQKYGSSMESELRNVVAIEFCVSNLTHTLIVGFLSKSNHLGLVLSALYAKLLVVCGTGFSLAEVISSYIPAQFYDVSNQIVFFNCTHILLISQTLKSFI